MLESELGGPKSAQYLFTSCPTSPPLHHAERHPLPWFAEHEIVLCATLMEGMSGVACTTMTETGTLGEHVNQFLDILT